MAIQVRVQKSASRLFRNRLTSGESRIQKAGGERPKAGGVRKDGVQGSSLRSSSSRLPGQLHAAPAAPAAGVPPPPPRRRRLRVSSAASASSGRGGPESLEPRGRRGRPVRSARPTAPSTRERCSNGHGARSAADHVPPPQPPLSSAPVRGLEHTALLQPHPPHPSRPPPRQPAAAQSQRPGPVLPTNHRPGPRRPSQRLSPAHVPFEGGAPTTTTPTSADNRGAPPHLSTRQAKVPPSVYTDQSRRTSSS
uniref:Atherin-like n=1 Tax=Phascolarctos cinereus TaxID=38626 RepID=A0A6P5L6F5_PHACI|nr:atherin-like [Phascolarctos cinereus]